MTLRWRDIARFIPAVVKLLGRLATDDRIERKRRLFAAGALGYALVPFDLLPDRVPILGKIDDAFLLMMALDGLVSGTDPAILEEHWDGAPEDLAAFTDAVAVLAGVVPGRLRRIASKALA